MLLEKYSPGWKMDFIRIKSEIDKALAGLAYTIEHVGSTAVPYLDAKPIIDMDIVYLKQETFEEIKQRLEKLGYDHYGNQGIEDREVFKWNGKRPHKIMGTIIHHLYVCSVESKALERHVLSRNYLQKNEWAREKYQQMKYALASMAHQDRKKYAALKELHVNAFIDSMIEAEKQAHNKSEPAG